MRNIGTETTKVNTMGINIINGGLIQRNATYKGLIFGSPKVGKTSLAAGAPRPILIDLDKGANRVAGKNRAGMDVATVDHYVNDFLPLISSPELKNYDTIVIDTFGALVDMIIRDKFSGIMNPSKWGIVKSEVLSVVNTLNMTGKSILFLAHESEEKNDDKIIKRPQCQGKAKDELMKMLDFIGHMTKNGNDYVLEFGGDDSIYCGNTYGFANRYVLPDIKVENNDFWTRVIVKQINDFVKADEAAGDALRESLNTWTERLNELKTADEYTKFLTDLNSVDNLTSGAVLKVKKMLQDKTACAGLTWNKDTKQFEQAQGAE